MSLSVEIKTDCQVASVFGNRIDEANQSRKGLNATTRSNRDNGRQLQLKCSYGTTECSAKLGM